MKPRCADCLDELDGAAVLVIEMYGETHAEKTVCAACAGWYRDKRGVDVVELSQYEVEP